LAKLKPPPAQPDPPVARARWVGIDEAGYGPNLGPLVMTAVVAEGPAHSPPDLWADLPQSICRAGGAAGSLWVDDSKLVYKGGVGRGRLEAGCRAILAAVGHAQPASFGGLLRALGSGTLQDVELAPWVDDDPSWLVSHPVPNSFDGAPWRLVEVRSIVMGPGRFNSGLESASSKASVHFSAFRDLLTGQWDGTTDAVSTSVVGDKHGGRHFYLDLLVDAFPGIWIDRGPEGPTLSRYTLREGTRRLDLSLRPKADSEDGLVALASLVSKGVRELWMEAFNAYWLARIPGLRPTAGYPGDATRFRAAIEPFCRDLGLEPSAWWRSK
jgi:hypothetical protein